MARSETSERMMNVQVIDGAQNCRYPIYAMPESDFRLVFPGVGQDIEFIGDVVARLDDALARRIFRELWAREVEKTEVCGIHGTLFYELDFKKAFYPTKRDDEMVTGFEVGEDNGSS